MQLNYNIIWIDDEIEQFRSAGDIDRVKSHLTGLGFSPSIKELEGGNEIEKHFKNQKFDLILSDFNIEQGHHGDEIIKKIRGNDIFTEVLFYSSQTDLKSIAEKLLSVDRISFHANRRGLIDKIETLISLSVEKLLELNPTRGLITAETSDLDVTIQEITLKLVSKLNLKKKDLEKIIDTQIENLEKRKQTMLQKFEDHGFEDFFIRLDAFRKWNICREFLKKLKDETVNGFLELNKSYKDEVIDIRNVFAHSKAKEEDGKLVLQGFGKDGKPYEFDESKCISIRKRLMIHREEFEKLRAHLKI